MKNFKTIIILLVTFVAGSFVGNSQILNYPVKTHKIRICQGDSVSVSIPNSQLNTTYHLLDKNNNTIGPTVTGNNNSLTFNSGALLANDTLKIKAVNSGSSLLFNGTNNQIEILNPNLGTSSISIAMWIKTTSTTQSIIAEKYIGSSGNRGFIFSMNTNGTLKFEVGNGYATNIIASSPTTTVINDGNWHHIIGSVTIGGGRAEIHIDGAKVALTNFTTTPTLNFNGNLTIGNGSLGHFSGQMDDINIFDRQTFPAEALAFLTGCNNPVPVGDILAYYKLNDGTGITALKTIGTWPNGIINGSTPVWTSNFKATCADSIIFSQTVPVQILDFSQVLVTALDSVVCPSGGAQKVDITTTYSHLGVTYSLRDDANDTLIGDALPGTGAPLTFAAYPSAGKTYNVLASSGNKHAIGLVGSGSSPHVSLSSTSRGVNKELTIALWIKTTDAGTVKRIMQNATTNTGYIIETNTTGKVQFKARLGSSTYKASGFSLTSINDGQWHQITVVADITNTGGSLWRLYIDGVQENSVNVLSGFSSTFSSTSNTLLGHPTVGITAEFDQLAIWNSALSASQVLDAYNYCIPTNSPNLGALYNFNEGMGSVFNDLSAYKINATVLSGNSVIWSSGVSPSCETAFCELEMSNKITVTVYDTNLTVSPVLSSVCLGDSTTITIQNSEVGVDYELQEDVTSALIGHTMAGTGGTLNFNTGAIDSATTFSVLATKMGNSNFALDFDGINDQVYLGADNRSMTNVVTISAWIKTSGPQTTGGIYFIASKLANNSGFRMWMNDAGKINMDGRRGTSSALLSSGASNASVNDNNWHYITGVFNVANQQSTIKIYIDGVLDKNTSISPGNDVTGNGTSLVIGNNGGRFFKGQIDQFSLWNKELSASEILANMNGCYGLDPNLWGHFKFNEGSGVVATDLSLTAINGTLTSMDPLTDWVAGDISCVNCSYKLHQTATVGITTIDMQIGISTSGNSMSAVNQPGATYIWLDCGNSYSVISGITSHTFTPSSSGNYAVEITKNGCVDTSACRSIIIPAPSYSSISPLVCNTYTSPSGKTWTTSSVYKDTIPNAASFDSIITINLTVKQSTTSTINTTSCSSYTSPSGKIWTTSNTYLDTINNAAGCDSVMTINLSINQTSSSISVNSCGVYTSPSGKSISASRVFNDTVTNSAGCDSLLTINLTIITVSNTVTVSGVTLTATETGATYKWLDCANSYTPISGATARSFVATTNGNYAVEISKNSCNDTSTCNTISTVGISDKIKENAFVVYPNPVTSVLTIDTKGEKIVGLKIFSVTGKLIESELKSNNTIDVSNYQSGLYIIQVETQNGIALSRFIKK